MKSKAAVLVADRRMEMRELPVPDSPGPGGILLRVEGCGMCGSDIEQYEGAVARAGTHGFPVIPGHEPIGRIAAIDPDAARVRGLKVGDRVAVHGVAPCGVCRGCMAGSRCLDAFYYGFRSLDQGSGLWGRVQRMDGDHRADQALSDRRGPADRGCLALQSARRGL